MDYKKAVSLYRVAQEWPRCGQDWGTYPQEAEAKSLLDGVATRYAQALMNRDEMARLGVTESEVLEHAHFCAHAEYSIGSLESIASAKAERAAWNAAQRAEIALWESMTPEQRAAHLDAEQKAAALLSEIFKGGVISITVTPTLWEAKKNKGLVGCPTMRKGFLIVSISEG